MTEEITWKYKIICDDGVCQVYEFWERGGRQVGFESTGILGETPEEIIEELELILADVKKEVKPE